MRKKQWLIGAAAVAVLLLGVAIYFIISLFTPKVGLCLSGENSTYADALENAGYKVLVRDDPAALLQEGVDLLVIQVTRNTDVSGILSAAGETPVLFVGDRPENMGEGYFVGCDKAQLGSMQANLLERYFAKADINGDRWVDYMLLSDSENGAYFQSANSAAGKYSTVKLEETICDGTADSAQALCKQAFSKYGRDLELIFCDSNEIAQGAVAAIRENGRVPGRDVVVFATGTEDACKEAVRTGAFTAAVIEDVAAVCDRMVQVVRDLFEGREVPQQNYVDYKVLTHENVDK